MKISKLIELKDKNNCVESKGNVIETKTIPLSLITLSPAVEDLDAKTPSNNEIKEDQDGQRTSKRRGTNRFFYPKLKAILKFKNKIREHRKNSHNEEFSHSEVEHKQETNRTIEQDIKISDPDFIWKGISDIKS